MILNTITNGVVLDHIQAGGAMEIYKALNLDKLGCQVAIIKNATSVKMGRKDILKICEPIDVNLDVLGSTRTNLQLVLLEHELHNCVIHCVTATFGTLAGDNASR